MNNKKLMLSGFLLILFVVCIIYFQDILGLFGVSFLIAFLLNPIAKFISKKCKIKHIFSIFIVFGLVVLSIYTMIITIMPDIAMQFKSLLSNIPAFVDDINIMYDNFTKNFDSLPPNIVISIGNFIENLDTYILNIIIKIASTIFGMFTKILDLVIVVILTFYFMLDGHTMLKNIAELFPSSDKMLSLFQKSYDMAWKYIKTQIVLSALMGIITFAVLSLLKVEYALLLAIFAFILDYIPYFGSILAGALATLVALLTGGPHLAIIVGISVLAIQQVQGNIIIPKVQGDTVGLHPIVVLFSILACNKLFGPIGMFIAIPLTGILKLFLNELYTYIKS